MGGKTSTTTQQVKIPPEVLARYNAVNRRAEDVARNPFQQYGTSASDFVAQLNPQQLQGIENVNTAAGAYQPYFEQARAAGTAGMASAQPQDLNIDKFMNPYQQAVIDATMKQMGQANEQAQSGALGTAASSGAFGGDRAGIAAANLANQQGLAMGSTLAGLNAQNYNQALAAAQQQQGLYLGATQADLARMMQGGQFMAGLGQAAQQAGLQGAEAQINAGTLGQQTEQAGINALYNQFQQEQAYPFQVAQFLANIAMGTGALSGSTTVTTQPSSWFSDRRLKEDIRRIGHTDDGLPIYKYKYKGDDNHQTHIGFMADEVEQVKPEAVGVSGGYKTVDYDRATKADGGGVAGPYGSAAGSQSPYAAGYVPQAYLPVGELMVADSGILDQANQSAAAQLQAAANFGENLLKLRDTYKDLTGKNVPPEADPTVKTTPSIDTSTPETVATVRRPDQYHGGVAGYADGGPAYLDQNKAAAQNPVGGQGYLSDTLAAQEKDAEKRDMLTPSSTPSAPQSTLGQIGDAASSITAIAKLAAMIPGISDRRLKHDIRRIGRTDHGLPIYSFKYKGDDREQTHIGFMADEVEKRHPDAVSETTGGYKRVDYDQAHKFYQGGVVRHGYATDGTVEDDERSWGQRYIGDPLRNLLQPVGDAARETLQPVGDAAREVLQPVGVAARETLQPVGDAARRLMQNEPATAGVVPQVPVVSAADQVAADRRAAEEAGQAAVSLGQQEPSPAPATGGLIPAAGTPFPAPTGTVAGGDTRMAGGLRPVADVTTSFDNLPLTFGSPANAPAAPAAPAGGVASAGTRRDGTPYDMSAASDFYRTRVIPQESGGRQFDKDGNPLTSSAGAVGIGQILPSTGPEAAKLAGLEWDENRFYNDEKYNAALGEAYFLEQYRRFGSLDKAAAAYNAGPSALSSALDRATALGGNYLDYLPNETQNYVASTTGMGGTNMRGVSGGVSDGYGIGGDKQWEDRTTMGKMFFDRDGRVNKDALLSILGGIGAMASSPSRYLGAAILQGIGGAANTYAAQEARRADITSASLQNAQTFMRQYMQAQEMGYAGSADQYAREIGYKGPLPSGIEFTPTTGSDRITSFGGIRLDPFGKALSMPTTITVNGQPVQVMAGQSYGFLNAYRMKLANDVAMGIPGAAETLAQVEASMAAHRGEITLPDGTTVQDPAYRSAVFGAGATASDVERTQEMRLALPQETRSAQEAARRNAELYKALSMLPSTGNLAPTFALIGRIGQQLGFNVPTNAAEGYDIASKIIAEETRSAVGELAGSVDTSMLSDAVERSTANPNMSPGAIEELLAIRAGIADYNLALARAKDEALRADRTANLAEVERNFVLNNKPEDFVDKRRPDFVGTIQRPAEAAEEVVEGSTSVDKDGRPIIFRNGKWELQ